jgi:hypothetical protein
MGKPMPKAAAIVDANAKSKSSSGCTLSSSGMAYSTNRKAKKPSPGRSDKRPSGSRTQRSPRSNGCPNMVNKVLTADRGPLSRRRTLLHRNRSRECGGETKCDKFSTTGKSVLFRRIVSRPSVKNILLYRRHHQVHNPFRPVPTEGRFAIVTIRRVQDAMDAVASGGLIPAGRKRSQRTAKSCGPGAATVASSWREVSR